MADQGVNGNTFSQTCKIAHVHFLPAGAADGWRASRIHSYSRRGRAPVLKVTVRAIILHVGTGLVRGVAAMRRPLERASFEPSR